MKVYELMEELGKCEAGKEVKISALVSDKKIIKSEKVEHDFVLELEFDEVYDDEDVTLLNLRE